MTLVQPLLVWTMRLNQEKSSDKDAICFGLVEDEYLPGPLKGPEFTICSKATLTSLYQSDWVIPSTSVAWKNLYLTEIFREWKEKSVLYKSVARTIPLGDFRKWRCCVFNAITLLESSEVKLWKASGAIQWWAYQAIPKLFPLKDFSAREMQPHVHSLYKLWPDLCQLGTRATEKKALEVTQRKI